VRASGGSSQGVELVRASEWVVIVRYIVEYKGGGGRGPVRVSGASWSGERCHGDLDGWYAGDREAVSVGAPRQAKYYGHETQAQGLDCFFSLGEP
jgi:hypothetical protein